MYGVLSFQPAQPSSTATTLRTTNGKTQVLDGPFIESKEQLTAGYYLIDAPDLDSAMQWAGRCPGEPASASWKCARSGPCDRSGPWDRSGHVTDLAHVTELCQAILTRQENVPW